VTTLFARFQFVTLIASSPGSPVPCTDCIE